MHKFFRIIKDEKELFIDPLADINFIYECSINEYEVNKIEKTIKVLSLNKMHEYSFDKIRIFHNKDFLEIRVFQK